MLPLYYNHPAKKRQTTPIPRTRPKILISPQDRPTLQVRVHVLFGHARSPRDRDGRSKWSWVTPTTTCDVWMHSDS